MFTPAASPTTATSSASTPSCGAPFFYLVNRGMLLPPGPDDQWTLSVAHTTDEIDRYIAIFREFAAELTA